MSLYTDYDQWFEHYKPVKNKIDKNASYDGCMYETYGPELETVRATNPNRVWTIMTDGLGEHCVTNGFHFVNRVGYFITRKHWKQGDNFNIYPSDIIEKYQRIEERENNGYQFETKVPAITEGLQRFWYGEGDHRNAEHEPCILAYHPDDKCYIILEDNGDGTYWRSLNEDYNTPQQAVDHMWVAFGSKIKNTEIFQWDESMEG